MGSRITGDGNDDNFDTEASVISSGKKGMKLTRDRLNEFQGLNDDTRSVISMQSNLTGFSRKSAVSMLNIDAIAALDSKKGSYGLPGAKPLLPESPGGCSMVPATCPPYISVF